VTDLSSYGPAAAVTYADSHWNNGVGLCAEFVSRSLRAGGLDVAVAAWVPNMVDSLAGTQYDEFVPGESGLVGGRAGDVVVYSNTSGAGFCN